MHEQCIKDEALKATYARLGRDKPHINPEATKLVKDEDEAKRPLSPTDGASAQHSIDVRAEGEPDSVQVNTKDSVDVRQSGDEDAPSAPEDSVAEPSVEPRSKSNSETPTKANIKAAAKGKPGRPKKRASEVNGGESKPWVGLFDVTLKMTDQGPPLLEFKDLREGIVGGEKTWTEPVKCTVCGNKVN